MVVAPTASVEMPVEILGSQVQYICPLPLETCLDRLQSNSDPKVPTYVARDKVFITIVYVSRGQYRYMLHPTWDKLRVAYRDRVRGALERIDDQSTAVTIDYRLKDQQRLLFYGLMVGSFVLFPVAGYLFEFFTGLIRSQSGDQNLLLIGLTFVPAMLFDRLLAFGTRVGIRRSVDRLVPRVYDALPAVDDPAALSLANTP